MDAMLRLLNLLHLEVDGDQLFLEIFDLKVVLLFIKELEPSVSVQNHSENKESNQKHNTLNMWVNF
jgi:hypothetical protein